MNNNYSEADTISHIVIYFIFKKACRTVWDDEIVIRYVLQRDLDTNSEGCLMRYSITNITIWICSKFCGFFNIVSKLLPFRIGCSNPVLKRHPIN